MHPPNHTSSTGYICACFAVFFIRVTQKDTSQARMSNGSCGCRTKDTKSQICQPQISTGRTMAIDIIRAAFLNHPGLDN